MRGGLVVCVVLIARSKHEDHGAAVLKIGASSGSSEADFAAQLGAALPDRHQWGWRRGTA